MLGGGMIGKAKTTTMIVIPLLIGGITGKMLLDATQIDEKIKDAPVLKNLGKFAILGLPVALILITSMLFSAGQLKSSAFSLMTIAGGAFLGATVITSTEAIKKLGVLP